MAVAIQMDFQDATLEQYDRVVERMGLSPGGRAPAGAISHFTAVTDDGLHVVDVWETREAYDRFAQEKIGPYSAEAGMSPPTLEFFEVHNHFTPGATPDEEELVRLDDAGMRAWNAHDPEALLELFADDFVWNDVAVPEPITTAEGLRDYMGTWFTAFPDMTARTTNRIIGQDSVAVEMEFTGTHTGPMRMGDAELPPTGVSVVGHGSYFIRVRDGKVVEFSSYPDLAGLLQQLGVLTAPTAAAHTTER
jgi:steroid delta-isomerase-like uncharacterized protein